MEPLAYHLTWTTYGTWLPGDARGWVESGVPGVQPPDTERERLARQCMAESAVLLSLDQREKVAETIQEHCRIRGWTLHADATWPSPRDATRCPPRPRGDASASAPRPPPDRSAPGSAAALPAVAWEGAYLLASSTLLASIAFMPLRDRSSPVIETFFPAMSLRLT